MLNRQPLRRQVVQASGLMLLVLVAAIVWAGNETRLERRAELSAQSASLAASVSTSLDQYLGAAYALGSTLARLFQPFVTTRRVGHGAGLGLSLSHGIIHSYGGTIGYYRNELGGATFYFELPAIATAHHVYDRPAVLQPASPTGV